MNHYQYDSETILRTVQGRWRELIIGCGVELPASSRKHGPCPLCGGKDRFRFDDIDGKGTWICNRCGAGNGLKMFMAITGMSYTETLKELSERYQINPGISQKSRQIRPEKNQSAECNNQVNQNALRAFKNIRRSVVPIDDSPVSRYLINRGLEDVLNQEHSIPLGLHPSLQYWDDGQLIGCYPSMIAPVSDPLGNVISLHRTYLTDDGYKANVSSPKKLLTAPTRGATRGSAIRLFPVGKDDHIALAEGIETAIAVTLATGIPCWSTINAGGLERVILPDNIKKVTIMADKDKSGTGQLAASIAADRFSFEQRQSRICLPRYGIPEDRKSIDWLDVYQSHREDEE